jgi:hypothetical protein
VLSIRDPLRVDTVSISSLQQAEERKRRWLSALDEFPANPERMRQRH